MITSPLSTVKKTPFLVIFLLAGCLSTIDGFPDRPFDQNGLNTTKFAFEAAVFDEYRAATGDEKRRIRNEILDAQLQAYDIQFQEFERELFRFGVGLGVGTDWLTLALNSIAATTGGAATKAALSTASAGVIGAKGAIDKHVFMEKTLPVVVTEMVNQRTAVLLKIRSGQTKPVSEYSLYQGLGNVEEYHRAGSLAAALVGIAKSAGAETKKNEEKITQILTVSFGANEATAKLRAFWRTGATVNEANEKKLQDEMAKFGLANTRADIAQFLTNEALSDIRTKIAQALGL